MTVSNVAAEWAEVLGLADAPLFSAARDQMDETAHRILLDGGAGSFALSSLDTGEIGLLDAASWAWSSDLPHHVGVSDDHVHVVRWDASHPRKFSRASIERQLEKFYQYLTLDTTQATTTIIDHAIELFRRIRSATLQANVADEVSIHIFLLFLSALTSRRPNDALSDIDALVAETGLNPEFSAAYHVIAPRSFPPLFDHFLRPTGMPANFRLWPSLMVRHAGGIVFQEAHYDLEAWKPADLLGLPGVADVKIRGRGGIHFTPPGLARALVERSLERLGPARRLRVFDPACGSGIFLHEVLRTLRRRGYEGQIALAGYDISPSAVAMARFTIAQALRDWPDVRDRMEGVDIRQGDSLDDDNAWPESDVVLMNPPFVSWGALDENSRDKLKKLLGSVYAGRADLSMAFIRRAVDTLSEGGVLGTLLPASLYSLSSGRMWREYLLDRASVDFLGVLGDHTLFEHAMVEVGALVAQKAAKAPENNKDEFVSVWTDETRGAASEALRAVRRTAAGRAGGVATPHWRELVPENRTGG